MNENQQNQIKEIKKSIDDLADNYPDISLFVDIIRKDFDSGYRKVIKPLIESYKIDDFIQYYRKQVNDLYGLVK